MPGTDLGAVVFHERCGDEDVASAAAVLARLFEHGPRRLDALGSSSELHVLDVALFEENP